MKVSNKCVQNSQGLQAILVIQLSSNRGLNDNTEAQRKTKTKPSCVERCSPNIPLCGLPEEAEDLRGFLKLGCCYNFHRFLLVV